MRDADRTRRLTAGGKGAGTSSALLAGATRSECRPRTRRRGMSLIEIMLVLLIIGVLLASVAPSFRRSLEQSHADIAAANLRSIWTAERLYWLENRTFCDSLSTLQSLDLVDATIVAAAEPYGYSLSADATTFTAEATRAGSNVWSGNLAIDETGAVTGSVSNGRGTTIEPGFLD
jgi:prepilin-type N-terminal cleavage/methylation domain-containing protein